MRSRRAGLSLLEILMATAVLSVAFLPIVASVHSLFRLAHRSQEATHGTFLVRAVLENIRHLAQDRDDRDAQRFFRALAEPVSPVVAAAGQPCSVYLRDFSNGEGSLAGISEAANPTLYRQLRSARVKVEVRVDEPDTAAPLDADTDMRSEEDLCEVHVEVTWPDESGHERHQEAWTVLSRIELAEPAREP